MKETFFSLTSWDVVCFFFPFLLSLGNLFEMPAFFFGFFPKYTDGPERLNTDC
jgi:hypothetical protein